jgi:hypothetical protein
MNHAGMAVKHKRGVTMTKLRFPVVLTVAMACALVAPTARAQMQLNGAGATFPYPIYSKWFTEYLTIDPSVRFNYQSIDRRKVHEMSRRGSGGGINVLRPRLSNTRGTPRSKLLPELARTVRYAEGTHGCDCSSVQRIR